MGNDRRKLHLFWRYFNFTVQVNGPAASLNVSIDCNNPLEAQISPTYYGVGGTTTYAWDFGDGNTSNVGNKFSYLFAI